MPVELETFLAIIGGIGVLVGIVFGLLQFINSRNGPLILVQTEEVFHHNLPVEFYEAFISIPISINITSIGPKAAENIKINFQTHSPIRVSKIDSGVEVISNRNNLLCKFKIEKLNPKETTKMVIFCEKTGNLFQRYLISLDVTIAQGRVLYA